MSIFVLNRDNSTYMFPAFKFQEESFAASMLSEGNVHLSNISVFRDTSRFAGQILDEREGSVTLLNGIVPTECNYYKQLNTHSFPESLEITISDAYVFCCTKYFLSDSLSWAISEGKECCVLITDVEEYINRISNYYSESLEFHSAKECQYIGRDIISKSALPIDLSNYFIRENLNAAFVKPTDYASQRELRLLWLPKNKFEIRDYINNNIDTTDLTIPVRFHDFDVNYSSQKRSTVGAKIIYKNGKGSANYQIQTPNEVFSPVIHSNNGKKMLGFLSTSNQLSGGYFSGGNIGILVSSIGSIVCNVYLEEIECIEIYTK